LTVANSPSWIVSAKTGKAENKKHKKKLKRPIADTLKIFVAHCRASFFMVLKEKERGTRGRTR
jgi:hypothetical protein